MDSEGDKLNSQLNHQSRSEYLQPLQHNIPPIPAISAPSQHLPQLTAHTSQPSYPLSASGLAKYNTSALPKHQLLLSHDHQPLLSTPVAMDPPLHLHHQSLNQSDHPAYSHINPDGASSGTIATRGRLRVSKACDRCRSQKIKCSGTHPCTTCVKSKRECNYTRLFSTSVGDKPGGDLQPRPGKPSSSKRTRGADADDVDDDGVPNPSQKFGYGGSSGAVPVRFGNGDHDSEDDSKYIDHLENRVKYLESLLSSDSNTTFREGYGYDKGLAEDPQNWPKLISCSSKWRFSRRHQNMLTVSLCQYVYNGLSEESRKQVVIPRTQYFGWNMSGVLYLTPDPLPEPPHLDLSPEKMAELVNFFLKEVNSLYAILHETVFREQVQMYSKIRENTGNAGDSSVTAAATASTNGPTDVQPEEPAAALHSGSKQKGKEVPSPQQNQTKLFSAKLYIVLAIAIRFTEFQKQNGPSLEMLQLEEKLFKYGNRTVEILSFEWESFELIQSWLLIALYLRVAHRQNSSYQALGRAITMTRSMGLGFESPGTYNATPYELLKAKRVFWSVYMLDRLFGLQQGRYCGIRENDTYRRFPSKDYLIEKDDWLSLPAFAMLQIARVSNFIHTLSGDTPSLAKFEQLKNEMEELEMWFADNNILDDSIVSDLSLVKSQIKLHYYDLVISIHGRVLMNYLGLSIDNKGFRLDMVVKACQGIITILGQINKVKLLTLPWYFNLLLLYNVGVISMTLINGSVYVSESKEIFKHAINLVSTLRKTTVKNDAGKVIFRERFKMAKECLWALKMTNHIVLLRLQEDLRDLNQIGIDHGSSDVNKQNFTQFGKQSEQPNTGEQIFTGNVPKNQKYGLHAQESHKRRKTRIDATDDSSTGTSPDQYPGNRSTSSVNNSNDGETDFRNLVQGYEVPSVGSINTIGNDFLGNIQWFDQWLDFNHDF